MIVPDYTTITELPGNKASQEQLARLYHRYHFASLFCQDKDVLEVACGSGIGLGYLANSAKRIVGGDVDENNLKYAKETYKGRDNIEIKKIDAHNLPFKDNSFDIIILFEAIYYLSHPEKFIYEVKRVLRKDGALIICTVNKNWADFNPSPFAIKYFSVNELFLLLNQEFSNIELYGAFPISTNSVKSIIISILKRTAVFLHIIPKTMKGKEIFKRIFFGRLTFLPDEITDRRVGYIKPIPISCDLPNKQYKVLYVVALTNK